MKRKSSTLVLLLALTPNTTRPLDELTQNVLWIGGSAIVITLVVRGIWSWYSSPYLCASCGDPILVK